MIVKFLLFLTSAYHDLSVPKVSSRLLEKKNRSNFGEVDVAPAKNDKVNKMEK